MNSDQNLAALRTLLTAVGPLLVTFGLTDSAHVGPLLDAVVATVGGASFVAGAVTSWLAHRHDAQIAAAKRTIEANPTVQTIAPIAAALRDAGADVSLTGVPYDKTELAAKAP